MPYQQILSQNLKSTCRPIWGAPVNTDGLGGEVHREVFAET